FAAGGVVQKSIVRPQANGLAVFGERFGVASEFVKDAAEIVVQLVAASFQFCRLPINRQGFVKPVLSLERDAKIDERDVVVLRHGEGAAEKRFAVAPEAELF